MYIFNWKPVMHFVMEKWSLVWKGQVWTFYYNNDQGEIIILYVILTNLEVNNYDFISKWKRQ